MIKFRDEIKMMMMMIAQFASRGIGWKIRVDSQIVIGRL